MVDNTIALQARAPRILSYGELVAGRDQEMSRRNALAMQQQQMQQNAMVQQKARATESAMAGAASLANAGEFDAAEKQYGLGAGNLEVHAALSKLSDEHRALVRSRFAAATPIAIQALQEPDMGKRAALVQAATPMLVQNGWKPEEIAQFQPTDQALSGIINNARTAEEALRLYDKQNEAYTLTPGSSRFVGNQPIANVAANLPQGQVTSYIGADGKPQIMNVVNGVAYPVTMGGARPGSPMGGAGGGAATALVTNPGALKDGAFARSQPGYKGNAGGFAVFETPEQGVAAQENLLRGSYINKGYNTIDKIVNRYAPTGGENSPASVSNYKQYIAQRTGVDINSPLSAANVPVVAAAMREFETGNRPGGNAPTAGGPLRPVPTATELKLQGKEHEAHRVAGAIGVKMDDSIRNVDALLNDPGLGEITGNWRGSVPEGLMALTSQTAANALAKYKTIAANATISELQELRASSPTGGALGQVSDYEDKMLRDAAATIARTQDLASFKKALLDYRNKLAAAKTRIEQSYAEDFGHEYGAYTQSGGVPGPRSGQKQVARTGKTRDGRTVTQYSDGSIEYGR